MAPLQALPCACFLLLPSGRCDERFIIGTLERRAPRPPLSQPLLPHGTSSPTAGQRRKQRPRLGESVAARTQALRSSAIGAGPCLPPCVTGATGPGTGTAAPCSLPTHIFPDTHTMVHTYVHTYIHGRQESGLSFVGRARASALAAAAPRATFSCPRAGGCRRRPTRAQQPRIQPAQPRPPFALLLSSTSSSLLGGPDALDATPSRDLCCRRRRPLVPLRVRRRRRGHDSTEYSVYIVYTMPWYGAHFVSHM